MPIGTTIVFEYASRQEYEYDAQLLAKLGYVVISVVEQLPPLGWVHWVRRTLFGSARVRLVVSYSDQGAAV